MSTLAFRAGLSEGPLFRRVRRRKYPEKTHAALNENCFLNHSVRQIEIE